MTSSRKVQLSPDAEDDLFDILQYTLDTWGYEQADAYLSILNKALEDLATFPGIGRELRSFGLGIRSYIVGQHVIIYLTTDAELVVSRVVHVPRDLERVMRG